MKHLPKLLIAFVMTFIMSVSIASAAGNFVTFTIDNKVYSKMSETQKSNLIQQIQELNTFVEEKIKARIPADLLEKMKDAKIKISFTDKPGRDGLFVPEEGGVHTISIQLVQLYSNGIKALLAHEIFHAIHFEINPDEATWVREGMAQLFESMTTNDLNGMNLAAAINNPMTPLLGTYDADQNNPAQYGHNQLYFYYLFNHCGKDQLFWKLAAGVPGNALRGSYLIDSVLGDMKALGPECTDFSESAISFEVAKAHNQYQFLKGEEKNKYFLFPGDITPKFLIPTSIADLKLDIDAMPVLTSFRLSLKKYKDLKGECKNCAIYFANKDFPYEVEETLPADSSTFDVILVKLRNK